MGSLRSHALTFVAGLLVGAGLFMPSAAMPAAHAQPAVGDADNGLPGIARVGFPAVERTGISLSASGGYAMTEAQGSEDGSHHRAFGTLAGALSLRNIVAAYLRMDGRFDSHPDDGEGADSGAVGDPRLGARMGVRLSPMVSVGGEVIIWMPGDEAPSVEPSASTVDGRLLLGLEPSAELTIAALGGFRLDNSGDSVPNPDRLRAGDRLVLGVSDFNAALAGVGMAYRLDALELLGELSADVLLGSDAPSFTESPLRATVGARYAISDAWQWTTMVDIGLSSRPDQGPNDPLAPVEPRFGGWTGLRFLLALDAPSPQAQPEPEPEPEPELKPTAEPQPVPVDPAVAAQTVVHGAVTDDSGEPVAGARIVLSQDEEQREALTGADGTYRIEDAPPGAASLTMTAEGLEEVTRPIDLAKGTTTETPFVTRISVPQGQIRGTIRSTGGKKVKATITIYPGKQKISSNDEGYFEADVEPGAYKVRIRAYGFSSQNRQVVVEDHGVTVLNVELKAK